MTIANDSKPKLILAGGSGFLGSFLVERWKDRYAIVILSRSKSNPVEGARIVVWDAKNTGDWVFELNDSDVLINLTGKSVDCRFNAENRELILNSRVDSTRVLGEAIGSVEHPPAVWINASGASIYPASRTKTFSEEDQEVGELFMAQVAKEWEGALFEQKTLVRQVALRISLILGKGGGVAPKLLRFAKLFLGGPQGGGKQIMSWMHEQDFARALEFIIENEKISGPVNMAADQQVTNKYFMKALRKAVHRPFGLPAPTPMLRLAAWVIGSEPELVLSDLNVRPKKLIDAGFEFSYPDLDKALEAVVHDGRNE